MGQRILVFTNQLLLRVFTCNSFGLHQRTVIYTSLNIQSTNFNIKNNTPHNKIQQLNRRVTHDSHLRLCEKEKYNDRGYSYKVITLSSYRLKYMSRHNHINLTIALCIN
jgi:hypothetical protein